MDITKLTHVDLKKTRDFTEVPNHGFINGLFVSKGDSKTDSL